MANHVEAIDAITQGFEFTDPLVRARLEYDAQHLGFLTLAPEGDNEPGLTDPLTIVGFKTYALFGAEPGVYHPITELDDLAPGLAAADRLGKGVGTRIYNTKPAASGYTGPYGTNSMYAVTLDPSRIMDMRRPSDKTLPGKLQRIAQHAGRLVKARVSGLQAMVDGVHESYGDSQAVLFSQPPNAARRQWQRGAKPLASVPDQFLILRDAGLIISQIAAEGTR